ncbi:MAG TPA: trypsin-like serine protease [Pseudonocardiaceae bacterium]|jgi:secreted trypsin-like serine protease|nr:trypsin-like serine protease [Pseudonocardiaceae bacterium]
MPGRQLPGRPSPAPTPRILGGADATNAPWAAQVSWDSTGFECSGTVVAPSWVLTAGHCANKGGMSVRVGSLDLGGGKQVTVDQEQVSPNSDLALLHLASPVKVPAVELATADPKVGAINEIYGWGMTAPGSGPAQVLKVAKVKVTSLDCVDAAQGSAICSTGTNGSAYNGDSGGPEMAAGQEVGVCSTGDEDAKSQQYASVAANRTWIQQVANV